MSSAKWQPFCPEGDELISRCLNCFSEEEPTSEEIENHYDIDTDLYHPIQHVGDDHGVTVVSPKLSRVHLHDLQVMHHGSTMVRWDSNNNHSAICYLRLENENSTLSWCKPQWSALRGASSAAPDYMFKGELETPGLCSKYAGGLQVVDELEEGHIDLAIIKEITFGNGGVDMGLLSKRHGLDDTDQPCCITISYGSYIADNRILMFVLPPKQARIWHRGLRRLVRAVIVQRRWHTDRRTHWLREQFLQLYYDNDRKHGPTPAEAIKVFGGRQWLAGPATSPSGNQEPSTTFKRTPSVMAHTKTMRKRPASSMAPNKVKLKCVINFSLVCMIAIIWEKNIWVKYQKWLTRL